MAHIDVYSMPPEQKRAYLGSFPAEVFYEAAKICGARLPVGRPAKDTADNIYRIVSITPTVANAIVTRLNRLYPDGFRSTANDWTDDPAPSRPQAGALNGEPVAPMQTPLESPVSDAALQALGVRVGALESWRNGSPDEFNIKGWIHNAVSPVSQALADSNSRLTSRIEALEKQTPIVIQTPVFKSEPISGQHYQFPRMVKWLTLKHNVMLIGPAGTGKTSAAVAFADAMKLPLYSQPLSLDSMAVLGFVIPNGDIIESEFYKAWVNGGVFLWDEISMSAPDAVGALNAALANGFCTLAGLGNVKRHPDFYCIAGDNSDTGASAEFSARSLLDGASLDRFRRIDWPVDPLIEDKVSGGHSSWVAAVRAIRAFITDNGIAHVGATMRGVIAGAEALSAGCFTRTEILEDTMRKGVLVAEWSRVVSLPAVRAFLQGA
jgi:MoxR-like ATPase